MKTILLTIALASGCALGTSANPYQQSPCHETGVLVVKDGYARLLTYYAEPQTAANGHSYYRWQATAQGYRYADGKMYVYDFEQERETVALDFTLQAGELFATPDGTVWTVEGTEQRTFTTLYGQDNRVDYQAQHTVLTVRSADGSKTDEWIENLGAVRHPLMLQADEDVQQAHVAYMSYGQESPYLVLDFCEAPLYGHYVSHVGLSEDCREETTIESSASGLTFSIQRYGDYQSRYYCYAYQNGDSFMADAKELGPYRDATPSCISLQFTLPGVPAGQYTATVMGQEVTAITTVSQPQHSATLYDLQGRPQNHAPQRGISIQDGKKVAWR